MRAVRVTLVPLAFLAAYLGWRHIVVGHGVGVLESICNLGGAFDCDTVNTSRWSALGGVPISFWALPLYGALFLLTAPAVQATKRGAAARRGLFTLSAWNVLVSGFLGWVSATELGTFCIFCISMYVLHGLLLLFVLLAGGRSVGLPEGVDLRRSAGAAAILAVALGSFAIGFGRHLDAQLLEAIVTGPAETSVGLEARDGSMVRLPKKIYEVSSAKHNWSLGPSDATVEVIEFADFQCGYCRKLSHVMTEIQNRYAEKVRFSFRHFPMDQSCNDTMSKTHHPEACTAAIASQCAGRQGKFKPFHDQLYKNQKHLKTPDLLHYADSLDLDVTAFSQCLSDPTVLAEIKDDIAAAAALNITGTPRTYVNGLEFRGAMSEGLLDAAIRVALGDAETTEAGTVRMIRRIVTDEGLPAGPVAMVPIRLNETTVYIDAVESAVDAEGAAVAEVGALPATRSWNAANQACQRAGKRLCTQAEWLTACQGAAPVDDDGDGQLVGDYSEGRLYPYADRYRKGLCHDTGHRERSAPRQAGDMPGCRTPENIYDLTGNVQEWIGADPDHAVLVGGHWYAEDKASCRQVNDTFGIGFVNATAGFRCCADSPPALAKHPRAALSDAPPAVGNPLPVFQGPTPAGGTFDSASAAGKVTLVNFWATWCGPCRKELPALARIYADYNDRGFEIIAVNVDRDPAKARALLKRSPLPFPVVLDPEASTLGRFHAVAMPTSVLADQNGIIIERQTGFSEKWAEQLREQLETLLP
jgi:protein-disulfide isomerase